jgi:hypothetical protein
MVCRAGLRFDFVRPESLLAGFARSSLADARDRLTAAKRSADWSQMVNFGAPGEMRTPDPLVRRIFLVAVVVINQSLATLAEFDSGLPKAQLRHSQSGQAAIVSVADIHKTVLPHHPAPGPRSSA